MRKYNIKILVENLNLFKKNERVVHAYPDVMLKAKRELGDRIGFTLDIGHVVSTPLSPVNFAEQIGPENIILAHLNDNHLTSDEHLAVGEGKIDYDSFIKVYVLENWKFPLLFETATVKSALKSREYISALIAKYE